MFKRLLFTALLSALTSLGLFAEEDSHDATACLRPVTSAYMINYGGASIADTYLSPLRYTGWNVALRYERLQAMKFNPERWIMQLNLSIEGSGTKNPVKNASIWDLDIEASWAMMHRWRFCNAITIGIGGETGITAGALYSKRNGNNPVAAKGAWTIGAKTFITYPLKLGSINTLLRWQISMPLAGVFFSPDYDELYYEIWLGNHSGLIHFAYPGNYINLINELTADVSLGSTRLRIGYRSGVGSTYVSNITSRNITNSLIIGITTEWLSINPSRPIKESTRIISALY